MSERVNSGGTVVKQQHGGALRPYQPGQSGNPAGRPTGRKRLATLIRAYMEAEIVDFKAIGSSKEAKELTERYRGLTVGDVITQVVAGRAMLGDVRAAKWLADNGYTKPNINELDDDDPAEMTNDLRKVMEVDAEIYRLGEAAYAKQLEEAGND